MGNSSSTEYGPSNPHALSERRTELVWEGKYDDFGNRRQVDVAGCAMPLQKIETVDEPQARLEWRSGTRSSMRSSCGDEGASDIEEFFADGLAEALRGSGVSR